MPSGSIFSKSFHQNYLKKLTCGALVVCAIMAYSFHVVFKRNISGSQLEIMRPIYNFSCWKSDAFEMNGDIRIHGSSSTIYIASSLEGQINSWTAKPYARKGDNFAMNATTTWQINDQGTKKLPKCDKHFSIPAIIFSTGGHSGNYFHQFNDILIPLYLTSRQFEGNVSFLVTDMKSTLISKYKLLLEKLSKYDIVDIDIENKVLCFARVIIGLRAQKEFGINPSEPPHYSMGEFRHFLRSTYSLEREFLTQVQRGKSRPQMLIISRRGNRYLTNEGEVANMARSLGFDVIVNETGFKLPIVAKFVNSVDVLVGVHGAGLTNMVFLPENAVVIQIIPFGVDFFAKLCFCSPAKDMNLTYLEYNVSQNESSLLGKYPLDSEVYRDPKAVYYKGFNLFHSVYLNNQNVTLNLGRFRETLLKVLELI